jgi:hypothetical protein
VFIIGMMLLRSLSKLQVQLEDEHLGYAVYSVKRCEVLASYAETSSAHATSSATRNCGARFQLFPAVPIAAGAAAGAGAGAGAAGAGAGAVVACCK